jgi:hypothetical protein
MAALSDRTICEGAAHLFSEQEKVPLAGAVA